MNYEKWNHTRFQQSFSAGRPPWIMNYVKKWGEAVLRIGRSTHACAGRSHRSGDSSRPIHPPLSMNAVVAPPPRGLPCTSHCQPPPRISLVPRTSLHSPLAESNSLTRYTHVKEMLSFNKSEVLHKQFMIYYLIVELIESEPTESSP